MLLLRPGVWGWAEASAQCPLPGANEVLARLSRSVLEAGAGAQPGALFTRVAVHSRVAAEAL